MVRISSNNSISHLIYINYSHLIRVIYLYLFYGLTVSLIKEGLDLVSDPNCHELSGV